MKKMKRVLLNILFTGSFISVFLVIIILFSDLFVSALTKSTYLFPKSGSLEVGACQQWTEVVRDFHVEAGEEAKHITVLMYHRIVDEYDVKKVHLNVEGNIYDTIVLKSEFRKQMELLKEHEYTTLTAREFKLFMDNQLTVPKNSILITFDDGFKDNYIEAYPILKEMDFKAINFLITGAIKKKSETFKPELYQYLSLGDLRSSCDIFEFESHTYNLHNSIDDGTSYLTDQSKAEVKEDIKTSIAQLGNRGFTFAYPFGLHDDKSLEIMEELHVQMAFIVSNQDAVPGMDIYTIPRKQVFPYDDIEKFKRLIHLSDNETAL